VDEGRLTRRQRQDQRPFAHLSPKREDLTRTSWSEGVSGLARDPFSIFGNQTGSHLAPGSGYAVRDRFLLLLEIRYTATVTDAYRDVEARRTLDPATDVPDGRRDSFAHLVSSISGSRLRSRATRGRPVLMPCP
jgi:hypothetical protein